MTARIGKRLLAIATLLAIYLMMLGSIALGDVVVGLALASLVELGWRRRIQLRRPDDPARVPRPPLGQALVGLPRLVWQVVVDIVVGTWEVSKYSLGFRDVDDPGFVEVELEGASPQATALWAFCSTVSPGEVVVDLDGDRGWLLIHALNRGDPDEVRARHRAVYENIQKKVVP